MSDGDYNQTSTTVDAGNGLVMHLTRELPTAAFVKKHPVPYVASLHQGSYPEGQRITCTIASDAHVSVPANGDPVLWLDGTGFTLPWASLLLAADFLMLDIPLPVPLGEQVPA